MLKYRSVIFGCDPEFFFTKNGQVIGAEKVLPEDGIKREVGSFANENGSIQKGESKIIIDGVQAELNPVPDTCRARLGNEISYCFRTLYKEMEKNEALKLEFSPLVKVSDEEMQSLSEKSKQFGCAPSKNIGGLSKMSIKDASKYPYRSAGGHLHFGVDSYFPEVKDVLSDPKTLIPILDIIVGNTCVLLDRDEGNIERRKVYGKAGEYRTPKHGIEYRTLSNFWLRSYPLMSMVFGLSRQAISIVADGHAKEILKAVNIKDVVKAINENDFDLAHKNFLKVLPIILEITPEVDHFPLHNGLKSEFMHFVKRGIDYWFKGDTLNHWVTLPEGHDNGFEEFLRNVVNDDMKYGN